MQKSIILECSAETIDRYVGGRIVVDVIKPDLAGKRIERRAEIAEKD